MFTIWLLFSALILLLLDAIYLYCIRHYFNNQVQKVQGLPIQVNYYGAAMCYVILILGLNYFIIRNLHDVSKNQNDEQKQILDAFLLGILIYGVYETTNLAILQNWSMKTVIIDTLWGGILLASTTAIIYALQTKF
jgi:uncharacterized membrane protein